MSHGAGLEMLAGATLKDANLPAVAFSHHPAIFARAGLWSDGSQKSRHRFPQSSGFPECRITPRACSPAWNTHTLQLADLHVCLLHDH